MSTHEVTSKRIRPGMYRVTTTDGNEYNVTDTQFEDGYYWTVTAYGELTSDPDMGLFRTKSDALATISSLVGHDRPADRLTDADIEDTWAWLESQR